MEWLLEMKLHSRQYPKLKRKIKSVHVREVNEQSNNVCNEHNEMEKIFDRTCTSSQESCVSIEVCSFLVGFGDQFSKRVADDLHDQHKTMT